MPEWGRSQNEVETKLDVLWLASACRQLLFIARWLLRQYYRNAGVSLGVYPDWNQSPWVNYYSYEEQWVGTLPGKVPLALLAR